MRRFKKNCNLYDCAPELVREWHPSANGRLTPQNAKIAYTKKVWWICGQSHEWQTTIKSRLNGRKCPLCARDENVTGSWQVQRILNSKEKTETMRAGVNTPFVAFEPDPADANFGHDFRKSVRYRTKISAVLEIRTSGHWFYADVKNFSSDGMCFESEAPVKPGTQIVIKLDRPLFAANRKNYISIIKWCKLLDNDDSTISGYAIGVKFI